MSQKLQLGAGDIYLLTRFSLGAFTPLLWWFSAVFANRVTRLHTDTGLLYSSCGIVGNVWHSSLILMGLVVAQHTPGMSGRADWSELPL